MNWIHTDYGPERWPWTKVQTSQTLNDNFTFIKADATLGNITITLPPVSTYYNTDTGSGVYFKIVRTDATSNTVTIQGDPTDVDTIDGVNSFTLDHQWESCELTSDNNNWFKIAGFIPWKSGVYTPTLTNVTNITSSTAYECQYMRIGNVVTVSGMAEIDQTAPGAIELGISLIFASDFTAIEQCSGTGLGITSGDDPMWIEADITNNRAALKANDTGTTKHAHFFHFTYRIL